MDVERTIEFLLEQQAGHDTRLAKIEQDILNLNSIIISLATSQQTANAIVEALTERQMKTEEELVYVTAKVGTVAERQAKTEEMLQVLIQLFQNHVTNH